MEGAKKIKQRAIRRFQTGSRSYSTRPGSWNTASVQQNSRMDESNFWRMEQGRKVDSILQMHGSSRKREKKLYESARKKSVHRHGKEH